MMKTNKNYIRICSLFIIIFLGVACSKEDEPQYDNDTQEKLINEFILKSSNACWLTPDMIMEDETVNVEGTSLHKNGFSQKTIFAKWTINDEFKLIASMTQFTPFPIGKNGAKVNLKEVKTTITESIGDLKVVGVLISSENTYYDNLSEYLSDYSHTEAGYLKDFSNSNFEFTISPNKTGGVRYISVLLESENLYILGPEPDMPSVKYGCRVDFIQYAE